MISWHLTGNSIPGDVLKIHVYDVIRAVESTNLQVMAIVSDMGPCNMALWRSMGIKVSKTHVIHYTANPVQLERRLYILADTPHILKSIRNNLLKYVFNVNECTAFAAEAVPQPAECLECCSDPDVVNNVAIDDMRVVKLNHSEDVKHIKTVIDVQENSELRIAHKLKNIHVNPDQHQKMNVRLAFQLLSDDTAVAIKTFIALGHLPSEANDAALFVQLVSSWYRIMSARHKGDALARRWKYDFRTKLSTLNITIDTFKNLRASNKWIPFQNGLITSTLSILAIEDELYKNGFDYILPRRFTQDPLENIFSVIRSKSDRYPTALKFRTNLRNICKS